MNVTDLENKRGYFFDGSTLLLGYIGGGRSIYGKHLSGKVIYDKPLYFSRTWRHGYKYDNWDWRSFEFIPYDVFKNIETYLKFIEKANYDEIKMYFKLKEVMLSEDFIECKIKL
jgi:hypothetical protein